MWYLAAVAVVSLAVVSRAQSPCSQVLGNATFNLCPLVLDENAQRGFYRVSDGLTHEDTSNYTYYFNVVDKMIDNDDMELVECKRNGMEVCSVDEDEKLICPTELEFPTYAYQQRRSDNYCWAVGGKAPSWELKNSNDPAEGVKLVYDEGEYCAPHAVNRKFNLILECADDDKSLPNLADHVEEEDCAYTLAIKSSKGCPAECGFTSQLCSGAGVCEYDWSNTVPKCFCFLGKTGFACEEDDEDASATELAAKTHPDPSDVLVVQRTIAATGGDAHDFTVEFDLTGFRLSETGAAYEVLDSQYYDAVDERDYTYYVGMLEELDLTQLPDECKSTTPACTEEPCNTTALTAGPNAGSVFQFNTATNSCVLLGGGADGANAEWALLDADEPAAGVSLTYSNGGYCGAGDHTNREFIINFVCPDAAAQKVFEKEAETTITARVVEEDDHRCSYTMEVETAAGCPYQCITDTAEEGEFQVCGGRGVCVADTRASMVRCLCDTGYGGDECGSTVSTSGSSSGDEEDSHVAWLVVLAILLSICACAGGYQYYRRKKFEKQFGAQLINRGLEEDFAMSTRKGHVLVGAHDEDEEDEDEGLRGFDDVQLEEADTGDRPTVGRYDVGGIQDQDAESDEEDEEDAGGDLEDGGDDRSGMRMSLKGRA